MAEATCTAAVNIAVVKYWGKRDTSLVLPTNSSLSVTLSQDHLRSLTSAQVIEGAASSQDRLWLNGVEEEIQQGGRTERCLSEMRALRKQIEDKDSSLPKLSTSPVHIASENNFPTAAGLASSASGLSALIATLSSLYALEANGISVSDLSRIARQGSGSACRSMFGGFVVWEMGQKADGSDSVAVQVAPREHWPTMQALILVVSDHKKGTSSTSGMQRTVATSELLQHRIKHVVPARMARMEKAIQAKDFDAFALETMTDSNQFHAVCLDTEPPIFYMNDVSKAIIALTVEINRISKQTENRLKVAYTFDAGPNAVLYAEEKDVKDVLEIVLRYFPQARGFEDPFGLKPVAKDTLPEGFNDKVIPVFENGSVSRIIHTEVGDGPRGLSKGESLLGADGLPKSLKA
ncbi:diphosphomevalonate decarboxylase [Microbotryum lychnidis-dioicae p1A1 Lamole]|uniref:Diphosphomevalonate decarboxylase n=1 Tax=Microbotryum lychnidis-dioicae (strain p1A1 Lamole / MvSl-1064) TaxID=683840 RepID=U5H495_USTV1|nr:diphosphomevalonate decarboxylase [Microbotryum lychnidis-dioicae p1A1 Lamole]|eukprot:KDE07680.1 diphosphomevalonate decarboxylase [Microbotryum lychnidis-dioicae p1A1 Lamole]